MAKIKLELDLTEEELERLLFIFEKRKEALDDTFTMTRSGSKTLVFDLVLMSKLIKVIKSKLSNK